MGEKHNDDHQAEIQPHVIRAALLSATNMLKLSWEVIELQDLALDKERQASRTAQANNRELWRALLLIVEAVETRGPPSAPFPNMEAEPDPLRIAEHIVRWIHRVSGRREQQGTLPGSRVAPGA